MPQTEKDFQGGCYLQRVTNCCSMGRVASIPQVAFQGALVFLGAYAPRSCTLALAGSVPAFPVEATHNPSAAASPAPSAAALMGHFVEEVVSIAP